MTGSGFQVMLVDAARTGALSRRLGFEGSTGVSDVLQHEVTPEDAIEVAGDVWVMPAGTDPTAAEDLTAGPGFTDMVHYLGVGADYVLVVAPPADTSVGLACAAAADTVLLVAADGRTTQERVERQFGHLAAHRLQVDGIVLAGPSSALRRESPVVAPDLEDDVDATTDQAAASADAEEPYERPLLRLAGRSGDVGKSA
jgi:Mrp family chromosome partitioning ATPase